MWRVEARRVRVGAGSRLLGRIWRLGKGGWVDIVCRGLSLRG
jgi:hypothetical protein